MADTGSGRRRVLILHCYPGGLGPASGAPWRDGSRIWSDCLRLEPEAAVTFADATDESAALPPACDFDAVLITGSPAGVYERDRLRWIARLEAYIRAALARASPRPRFVGGCFGAQVLASALGGIVEPQGYFVLRAEELELLPALAQQSFAAGLVEGSADASGGGYAHAELTRPAPAAFAALAGAASVVDVTSTRLRVLECHGDCVRSLPEGAELLARSQSCENELFTLAHGRALCIQGHPEFSVVKEIDVLCWPRQVEENIRLSAEESAAARPTFALPRHQGQILTLLRRFMFESA